MLVKVTVALALQRDALKRLQHEWLDEITGTYVDYLAKALVSANGPEDIQAVLGDLKHAELIALTEVSRARNAGAYQAFEASQTPLVRWVTTSANPCPECVANEAAGPWPLGKPFPSGAVMPPDHPRCQCHLEPA